MRIELPVAVEHLLTDLIEMGKLAFLRVELKIKIDPIARPQPVAQLCDRVVALGRLAPGLDRLFDSLLGEKMLHLGRAGLFHHVLHPL